MRREDSRSYQAKQYHRLYKLARWRRVREAKLSQDPLCEWCLEREIVEPATEVHHAEAHRGDLDKFWGGPLVSTCKACHSSRGQREDRGLVVPGTDEHGWPSWRAGN